MYPVQCTRFHSDPYNTDDRASTRRINRRFLRQKIVCVQEALLCIEYLDVS